MAIPVLHLSYLGGLGGGETMWLSQLQGLDRRQWEPFVVCGTEGAFVDELGASGIEVEVIPYRLPFMRYGVIPSFSPRFAPQLARYMRDHGIRLVHCKDPHSAFYAAPVARALGIPVIWTCTSWWHAERGWKSRFYDGFLQRILVWTELIRDKLVETNVRLADKTVVVPSGVDVDEFKPTGRDPMVLDELGIPRDARVVTLLARFQEVKGHEYFLTAASEILRHFPGTRFLIVGDNAFRGDEAETYRRMILDRIERDVLLREHVVLAGFRRDIPRLLNASDVLVCPSLFETYGMSNIEAMACGIPVVSTNVGGPSETVADGETGFLVPPRDPAAIAARVCRLLGDETLRERMGANGRARVLKHFTLRQNVERLERLYQETLENGL